MLCAISGEAPQVPVLSRKSGNVYEKRLIEAYITENGSEPTTGESLTAEDLLDVKTPQIVRPRPPTLTSIPALLGVFQEEWDALALETFTLQQSLAQARQELSTALYQHDAAVRVVARLTRERDEARDALAKINVGERVASSNGTNGEAMQVDDAPLSDEVVSKIEKTQQQLMKTRRKRPVPEGWATAETITGFKTTTQSELVFPDPKFLATDPSGQSVLLGGAEGVAGVWSVSEGRVVTAMRGANGAVTSGVWAGSKAVISTSSGEVKIFEGETETCSFKTHSGSVTGLTIHPCGDIIASVSDDKSYTLYDLTSSTVLTQVFTDSELTCVQFHPDGHLLAAGGADGQIRFFDVKTGGLAGSFETGEPLKALFFSENGTWVAAATAASSVVAIWDLRKVGTATEPIKILETGSIVESLSWDYSAQFLLVGGHGGISVEQYSKSTKEWSEPLKLAVPASGVAWGKDAQSIFAIDTNGMFSILSPA